MKFELTPEDEAFRQEIRAFLRDEVPPDYLDKGTGVWFHPSKANIARWHRLLYEKGWVALHWPTEYGGTGWSPLRRFLFENECVMAGAPALPAMALRLIGPVLYTYGSEALQRQHLPGILNADVFWCQGFSEPGAGSDLASLKTRAVRDGDEYVISGHKIWTTNAHQADWMFCLARTNQDAKPQEGISFILIDMQSPGITVNAIPSIDWQHYVNEVFLDEVRVPVSNLVGQEGQGWSYAKFLLGNERTGGAKVPELKRDLQLIRALAAKELSGADAWTRSAEFERRIAEMEIELLAIEWTILRVLSGVTERDPAVMGSILKVRGSELQQQVAQLAMDVLGPAAAPLYPTPEDSDAPAHTGLAPDYGAGAAAYLSFRRAATIYAGADEIQRTLLAKQLGL